MKVTLKRVKAGDEIPQAYGPYAIFIKTAPKDGLIISREYAPSLYIPWDDLDDFRSSEDVSRDLSA